MIKLMTGRPQTAEEMVHTVLQRRILQGALRPGERVDLDVIAGELAVSRTPVRTALRQLASEGLVQIFPHRSAVVSALSAHEIEQIYVVRIHLETFAARASVPNLAESDFAELRQIHQRMNDLRVDVNPAGFADQDRAFHLALYRGAGNPFLSHTIDDLRKASLRFLASYAVAGRLPTSIAEHGEIIAAAQARDGEGVADLIRRNLEQTGEIVAGYVRAQAS
ncbi:MAG: GntR family transcriptional regulator [Chloroflexota bacterium]